MQIKYLRVLESLQTATLSSLSTIWTPKKMSFKFKINKKMLSKASFRTCSRRSQVTKKTHHKGCLPNSKASMSNPKWHQISSNSSLRISPSRRMLLKNRSYTHHSILLRAITTKTTPNFSSGQRMYFLSSSPKSQKSLNLVRNAEILTENMKQITMRTWIMEYTMLLLTSKRWKQNNSSSRSIKKC